MLPGSVDNKVDQAARLVCVPQKVSGPLCSSVAGGGCISSACNDSVGHVITGMKRQAAAEKVKCLRHEVSRMDVLLLPGVLQVHGAERNIQEKNERMQRMGNTSRWE